MDEAIVACAARPADYVALHDDGERVGLVARSGEWCAPIVLDRAGAAALHAWLGDWLAKEENDDS